MSHPVQVPHVGNAKGQGLEMPSKSPGGPLLPGVVVAVGITHPWGEGHLLQQPPGLRAPCPALLPMPRVTTGVRDISEEAAGA